MNGRTQGWLQRCSSDWRDWPVEALMAAKARAGCRISLVIPARNEAATVAGIVAALRRHFVTDAPLLDELVVIDSDSTDATASVAAAAGAIVHSANRIRPEFGNCRGKGEAIWKSLFVTTGDVLVYFDADLTVWRPQFLTGLLGPLLARPGTQLVRASYTRLRRHRDGDPATSPDGGRLTELVARPLIGLYWPELAGVLQPLAGEWAARRDLLESLYIPVGYAVELSTLIDTATMHGPDAIAQVHLGSRAHRHRPDSEIALAAAELMAAAENRRHPDRKPLRNAALHQVRHHADGSVRLLRRAVHLGERPPAARVRLADAALDSLSHGS